MLDFFEKVMRAGRLVAEMVVRGLRRLMSWLQSAREFAEVVAKATAFWVDFIGWILDVIESIKRIFEDSQSRRHDQHAYS